MNATHTYRGDPVRVTQIGETANGEKLASGFYTQTLASFQHLPLEWLQPIEQKVETTGTGVEA